MLGVRLSPHAIPIVILNCYCSMYAIMIGVQTPAAEHCTLRNTRWDMMRCMPI